MSDEEKAQAQAAPAEEPAKAATEAPLLAEIRIRPDGKLALAYSKDITDLSLFVANAIDLLAGMLLESLTVDRQRQRAEMVRAKVLRVPPGARVKTQ